MEDTDLLRLGQVDPQLPPGAELLPVAEVEGHLLAGVPGHQRRAVLHRLVCRLHVLSEPEGTPGTFLTNRDTHRHTRWG